MMDRKKRVRFKRASSNDARFLLLLFALKAVFKRFISYLKTLWYVNPYHLTVLRLRSLYFADSDGKWFIEPSLGEAVVDFLKTENKRREDILRWARRYATDKTIENFTTSWQDGTALCALIGRIHSKTGHLLRETNPLHRVNNCRLALKAAQIYFSIPQDSIAPEEIVIGSANTDLKMFKLLLYLRWKQNQRRRGKKKVCIREIFNLNRQDTLDECYAKGHGLSKATVGKEASFTLHYRNGSEADMKISITVPTQSLGHNKYTTNGLHLNRQVDDSFHQIPHSSKNNLEFESINNRSSENITSPLEEKKDGDIDVKFHLKWTGANECLVTYTPTKSGLYTVKILWKKKEIPGTPFIVCVSPGSSPTRDAMQWRKGNYNKAFWGKINDSSENGHAERIMDPGYEPERSNWGQVTVTNRRILKRVITKGSIEKIVIDSSTSSNDTTRSCDLESKFTDKKADRLNGNMAVTKEYNVKTLRQPLMSDKDTKCSSDNNSNKVTGEQKPYSRESSTQKDLNNGSYSSTLAGNNAAVSSYFNYIAQMIIKSALIELEPQISSSGEKVKQSEEKHELVNTYAATLTKTTLDDFFNQPFPLEETLDTAETQYKHSSLSIQHALPNSNPSKNLLTLNSLRARYCSIDWCHGVNTERSFPQDSSSPATKFSSFHSLKLTPSAFEVPETLHSAYRKPLNVNIFDIRDNFMSRDMSPELMALNTKNRNAVKIFDISNISGIDIVKNYISLYMCCSVIDSCHNEDGKRIIDLDKVNHQQLESCNLIGSSSKNDTGSVSDCKEEFNEWTKEDNDVLNKSDLSDSTHNLANTVSSKTIIETLLTEPIIKDPKCHSIQTAESLNQENDIQHPVGGIVDTSCYEPSSADCYFGADGDTSKHVTERLSTGPITQQQHALYPIQNNETLNHEEDTLPHVAAPFETFHYHSNSVDCLTNVDTSKKVIETLSTDPITQQQQAQFSIQNDETLNQEEDALPHVAAPFETFRSHSNGVDCLTNVDTSKKVTETLSTYPTTEEQYAQFSIQNDESLNQEEDALLHVNASVETFRSHFNGVDCLTNVDTSTDATVTLSTDSITREQQPVLSMENVETLNQENDIQPQESASYESLSAMRNNEGVNIIPSRPVSESKGPTVVGKDGILSADKRNCSETYADVPEDVSGIENQTVPHFTKTQNRTNASNQTWSHQNRSDFITVGTPPYITNDSTDLPRLYCITADNANRQANDVICLPACTDVRKNEKNTSTQTRPFKIIEKTTQKLVEQIENLKRLGFTESSSRAEKQTQVNYLDITKETNCIHNGIVKKRKQRYERGDAFTNTSTHSNRHSGNNSIASKQRTCLWVANNDFDINNDITTDSGISIIGCQKALRSMQLQNRGIDANESTLTSPDPDDQLESNHISNRNKISPSIAQKQLATNHRNKATTRFHICEHNRPSNKIASSDVRKDKTDHCCTQPPKGESKNIHFTLCKHGANSNINGHKDELLPKGGFQNEPVRHMHTTNATGKTPYLKSEEWCDTSSVRPMPYYSMGKSEHQCAFSGCRGNPYYCSNSRIIDRPVKCSRSSCCSQCESPAKDGLFAEMRTEQQNCDNCKQNVISFEENLQTNPIFADKSINNIPLPHTMCSHKLQLPHKQKFQNTTKSIEQHNKRHDTHSEFSNSERCYIQTENDAEYINEMCSKCKHLKERFSSHNVNDTERQRNKHVNQQTAENEQTGYNKDPQEKYAGSSCYHHKSNNYSAFGNHNANGVDNGKCSESQKHATLSHNGNSKVYVMDTPEEQYSHGRNNKTKTTGAYYKKSTKEQNLKFDSSFSRTVCDDDMYETKGCLHVNVDNNFVTDSNSLSLNGDDVLSSTPKLILPQNDLAVRDGLEPTSMRSLNERDILSEIEEELNKYARRISNGSSYCNVSSSNTELLTNCFSCETEDDGFENFATGPGLREGAVGEKNFFEVHTDDAASGPLIVFITGPRPHSVTETSVTYTGDNVYDVTYEAVDPGYYTIELTWGTSIHGSPFTCKISY